MSVDDIKYVIIDAVDVDSIDFSKVKQVDASVLRYSMDGTKTFVKYEGAKPYCLYGKTVYTHSQMVAILNDPAGDWVDPNPDF
jgi:hypothetical protein